MLPVPDLLAVDAAVRVDTAALRQALVFGFATGSSVETFEGITSQAVLPASNWDRADFARDLFLDQLVLRCLPVRAAGRSFSHWAPLAGPLRGTGDHQVTTFRQAILQELATNRGLRTSFERTYAEIVELRALLSVGRGRTDGLRRIDILRAARRILEDLASAFRGATSGLKRLDAFGQAVVETPAFLRLKAWLEHDDHLGTLDVRVGVGADGELRSFQIIKVGENRENPFYVGPIGRLLSRIWMMLRGYRLTGGELVEHVMDHVFTGLEDSLVLVLQLVGDMEFYLAGLGLREVAKEKGLPTAFPRLDASGQGFDLRDLYNPLLLLENLPPVPCNLVTTEDDAVVIVTGPNSGGKTRLLQAIALTQLLAQAGLFVPASSARMPRVPGLFVSILNETRADQPEGQLGMKRLRIRRMFEQIRRGSLVVLDELCSGTNPSEGEEIARLVLSLLPQLRAEVFVTTHLLSFASRLAQDRSIAKLEFLQVELGPQDRPTYRFVPGVATTSLAHKTAARLGVTREELQALIGRKNEPGV